MKKKFAGLFKKNSKFCAISTSQNVQRKILFSKYSFSNNFRIRLVYLWSKFKKTKNH